MYSSGNVRVKFRIVRVTISDVIDLFGRDVRLSDEDEEGVTVTTTGLSKRHMHRKARKR